jgi:hypothetical protein
MGQKEMDTRFWWGDLKETECQEDIGIDGRIILKWLLETQDDRVWTGFM